MIEDVALVGHPTERLPNNVSILVRFVEGESMLLFLDMEGVEIASGSACISRSLKVSHVMLAMEIDAERLKVHCSSRSDKTIQMKTSMPWFRFSRRSCNG